MINIFKKYLNTLIKCSLFKNINSNELLNLITCINPRIINYNIGDTILYPDTKLNEIGIVINGCIEISKDKRNGTKIILNKYYKGDIFGELIAFSTIDYPYITITSNTETTIMFLKTSRLKTTCSKVCNMHNTLISNIIEELANKAMLLNSKVRYLSIKSMRAKLCTFLYDNYIKFNKKEFNIYLTRNELANFLNVSRPSMSRELGRLRDENILKFKGNKFELLNIKELAKYVE